MSVEELEIQINSCSVKGVMVHTTVIVSNLHTRWFLGYTCCDACGRLFVKGNYCPVCLKVYRDSESTPMVCCDVCHKWVHCPCDGIRYFAYLPDDQGLDMFGLKLDVNFYQTLSTIVVAIEVNLFALHLYLYSGYLKPTILIGLQVRNLEEAVQELWRRRDESDKDLIASLRAAAGLPTQDEIFDISPFSDDEESGPVLKNEFSRSLKFSLKGLGDKSPKKNKESGKKSSKKKSGKKKGIENEEMRFSSETDTLKSPIAVRSLTEGVFDGNEAAVSKHKSVDEVSAINITKASRTIKIKSSNRSRDLMINREETGISSGGASKTAQGPKLVIHLGGRSRNATSPPRSESRRGQELTSVKGTEDTTSQLKHHELIDRPDPATKLGDQKGHKKDRTDQMKVSKLIKLKNSANPEPADGYESVSPKNTTISVLGKRSAEDGASARSESEVPVSKRNKYPSIKHSEEDDASISGNLVLDDNSSSVLRASSRDRKPSLKFKIPKTSNNGNQKNVPGNLSGGINQNSLSLPGKEDITYTRGQRSKRRRPAGGDEDGGSQWGEDNTVKDFRDANWVLQRLGKDAAGKRVEIHQPSNNSWHRGTVIEIFEGTSVVSIALDDDGKAKSFELGKQGIRFVSQKQKH
ncbi:histone-lysine n-methyltransferase 2b [Phtheirospermum japonicum]|uniref:Histone-lysine n-methyltransferase 2b n=1 Tax=Phtheirospermum japonicum TaxID=374723 RepID=A0A830BS69_9LAMI|nr:histone-lysine n-methyltransferase 2b [Phtheirospermum japonicum]